MSTELQALNLRLYIRQYRAAITLILLCVLVISGLGIKLSAQENEIFTAVKSLLPYYSPALNISMSKCARVAQYGDFLIIKSCYSNTTWMQHLNMPHHLNLTFHQTNLSAHVLHTLMHNARDSS